MTQGNWTLKSGLHPGVRLRCLETGHGNGKQTACRTRGHAGKNGEQY